MISFGEITINNVLLGQDIDYLPQSLSSVAENAVPLAESVHDVGCLPHWPALHPPRRARVAHPAILLFVREFKQDRVLGAAAAYTYLGSARYVSHEGSRPMNVTCELDRPIPAKYLKTTNKLVVG